MTDNGIARGGSSGANTGLFASLPQTSGMIGSGSSGPKQFSATQAAPPRMQHGSATHGRESNITASMRPGGVCMDYLAGHCPRGSACFSTHILLPLGASTPAVPPKHFQVQHPHLDFMAQQQLRQQQQMLVQQQEAQNATSGGCSGYGGLHRGEGFPVATTDTLLNLETTRSNSEAARQDLQAVVLGQSRMLEEQAVGMATMKKQIEEMERTLISALLAFEQRHWGPLGSLASMEHRLALKLERVANQLMIAREQGWDALQDGIHGGDVLAPTQELPVTQSANAPTAEWPGVSEDIAAHGLQSQQQQQPQQRPQQQQQEAGVAPWQHILAAQQPQLCAAGVQVPSVATWALNSVIMSSGPQPRMPHSDMMPHNGRITAAPQQPGAGSHPGTQTVPLSTSAWPSTYGDSAAPAVQPSANGDPHYFDNDDVKGLHRLNGDGSGYGSGGVIRSDTHPLPPSLHLRRKQQQQQQEEQQADGKGQGPSTQSQGGAIETPRRHSAALGGNSSSGSSLLGIGDNPFSNSGGFSFGGAPLDCSTSSSKSGSVGGTALSASRSGEHSSHTSRLNDFAEKALDRDSSLQSNGRTPFSDPLLQRNQATLRDPSPSSSPLPKGGHHSNCLEQLPSDASDTLAQGPQRLSSAGSTSAHKQHVTKCSASRSLHVPPEVIREVKDIQDKETDELLHVFEDFHACGRAEGKSDGRRSRGNDCHGAGGSNGSSGGDCCDSNKASTTSCAGSNSDGCSNESSSRGCHHESGNKQGQNNDGSSGKDSGEGCGDDCGDAVGRDGSHTSDVSDTVAKVEEKLQNVQSGKALSQN